MKKNRNYRKQSGFSLLEVLLVLGVGASLILGAFVVYPKVQASSRANQETSNILTLSAGIQQLYSTSRNYATLTVKALNDSKTTPESMISGVNTMNNIWAGAVTVTPTIYGGVANAGFQIVYNTVPSVECTKIVTGVGAQFATVKIGTVIVRDDQPGATKVGLDPARVASECKVGDTANKLTLIGR